MSTAYERVLARRAKRLGVSLEEAAKVTGKPLYLIAAEKEAVRRGVTVEAVLEDDLKRMKDYVEDMSNGQVDFDELTDEDRDRL
jgi:hypothetical protein